MKLQMKKNTFRLGACIYAGILAVLITVLLIVFFCFISAFEKTRPESFMRSYISENEKKGWDKAIAGAPLAGVHTPFESEAYLRSKLTDMYFSPDTEEKKNVTFYKKSGKYTSERPVYAIYFSDTEMLELSLEKNSEKTSFGLQEWQISEIHITALYHLNTSDFYYKLPDSASLLLNNVRVDTQACQLGEKIQYEELSPFEKTDTSAFYRIVCKISGLYFPPQEQVFAQTGEEIFRSEMTDGVAVYGFGDRIQKSYTVTAPSGAEIKINGYTLSQDYLTEMSPYETVNPFEQGTQLPQKCVYRIENLFSEPQITVFYKEKELFPREAENENYIYDIRQDIRVELPCGYILKINGITVDSSYFIGKTSPAALKDVENITGLRDCLCTYAIDGFFETPELLAFPPETQGQPAFYPIYSEGMYRFSFPETEAEPALSEQILNFVKAYLTYTSKGEVDLEQNYAALLTYLYPGSPAHTLIKNTLNGVKWNSEYKVTYHSLSTGALTFYAEDCFSVRASYDVTFRRGSTKKAYADTLELTFVQRNNSWLICRIAFVA